MRKNNVIGIREKEPNLVFHMQPGEFVTNPDGSVVVSFDVELEGIETLHPLKIEKMKPNRRFLKKMGFIK